MSGGHFNYAFIRMLEFANDLKQEIINNNVPDDYCYCPEISDEGIDLLTKAQLVFEEAAELAKTIERCYSGDTGEQETITVLKASRLISDYTRVEPHVQVSGATTGKPV